MKGNRELDDLIIAYILEELGKEDEAFVLDYINSDESNRQHYEELRKTWKAITIKKGLEKVNTDDEWDEFEQRITGANPSLVVVMTGFGDEEGGREERSGVVEGIRAERGKKRSSARKLFVSLAVAASVLVVLVSGWVYYSRKEKTSETVSVPVAKTDEVISGRKQITNTSGKPERLLLPDGSEVVLADKSEISYAEAFTAANHNRDVYLEGEADFTVAQDKERPFTVYSFDLATTVLGTVFTVSAFEHAENIVIKLSSGKVVVRPAKKGSVGLKQDYYLLPGQQLIYNNRNYTAKLLDGNRKKDRSAAGSRNDEANTDMPDIPENNKGSWYMFNNESLEQVFDQLKLLYNTDIVYSKKDVYNLYFAGKFDKSDSLYTILTQIASVNNLKVSKKDNKYIIAK